MDIWQERGLRIAESNTVKKNRLGYQVPSQSGNGTYIVNMDNGEPFCSCAHFEGTHQKCQHIFAVEFIVKKEQNPDGTVTETKTVRVTYGQDWPAYNEAQTHEQERFVALLATFALVSPSLSTGLVGLDSRSPMWCSASVFKSYTTFSGRRFSTALHEAESDGLVTKAAHYNSEYRYLENPALTALLKSLIEQSAPRSKRLRLTSPWIRPASLLATYARWFDHKWGKERSEQTWVKTHLMCGVKTHVVTSVEVTPRESADTVQLPALVTRRPRRSRSRKSRRTRHIQARRT